MVINSPLHRQLLFTGGVFVETWRWSVESHLIFFFKCFKIAICFSQ